MVLNIIKKLLPPEEKIFYSLFNESIDLTYNSALILKDIVEQGATEARFEKARLLKERSGEVTQKILERLSSTFVTPFDREDIQTVAVFIHKITKKIARLIKHTKTYQIKEFTTFLRQQATLLVEICEALKVAILKLKGSTNPREITASTVIIHHLENKIEIVIKDAVESLFTNCKDPIELIKLGRLYRDFESTVESCSTLADISQNIVFKNS